MNKYPTARIWSGDENAALHEQIARGTHVTKLSIEGRTNQACVKQYYRLKARIKHKR